MNRRNFLIKLAIASTIPALSACSSSQPLHVGIHPWIGYETLYLAQNFAWLSPSIQLQYNHESSESIEELLSGKIDAACLTLDEVLRARTANPSISIILVFDVSAGADVVLAKPNIQKITDLEGKRVGVENNATSALLLRRMLDIADLDISAIQLIPSLPSQQLSLWRDNKVDAIISYDPKASLILREGAHILFDSKQIPDTIIDVLAVRDDLVQNKKSALTFLVAQHFRSLEHIASNRQDTLYRIAKHQDLTIKEVKKAFSGVVLPSLEANRTYLSPPAPRLFAIAKDVSSLLVRSGLLEKEDSLINLVNSSYLPRMMENV